jgi:hypothetical protein
LRRWTGFWIAIGEVEMKNVQLAIRDSAYAESLRRLLLRDGTHHVHMVERPNLGLDGVVVIDDNRFQLLPAVDSEPERFVLITRKGADNLSRVWNAGIRHVVFEEDSPNTAQLAIIAAELRLPNHGPVSKLTPISILGQPAHPCRRGGPKNAGSGF